ncbi:EAL domain-containing protein [Halobacillus rhizosphaerae]|uniref:EAL domain-containing protein n=1 Tax=Halobacillus rhizosphaerae TaxID=3064889 RepID=UPI00398A59D7
MKKYTNIFRKMTKTRSTEVPSIPVERQLAIFKSLFQKHEDTIYIFDAKERPFSFNHNFNHLLGYDQDQEGGLFHRLPKKSAKLMRDHLKKSLQGETSNFGMDLSDQWGKELHLNLAFIPIQVDQHVIGAYVMIKDDSEHMNLENLLTIRDSHLSKAQKIAHIGSWEYNYSTGELKCSNYFYELFKLSGDQGNELKIENFLSDPLFFSIYDNDRERLIKTIKDSVANIVPGSNEFRIRRPDHSVRFIRNMWEVTVQQDGTIKLIGVSQDITNMKEWELNKEKEQEQLSYIYDHLEGVVWNLDYHLKKMTYFSGHTEKILGLPSDYVSNHPGVWLEMVHPEDQLSVSIQLEKLKKGEAVTCEYRIVNKKEEIVWLETQAIPRFNINGEISHLFGFTRDITDLKNVQAIKEDQAFRDSLTGLYNRRHFYQTVHDWSKDSSSSFALLYFDLRRFQGINETLGFKISDQILTFVADRVRTVLTEDTYFAHLTGSKFALLLKDRKDEEEIYAFTNHLIEKIDPYFTVEEYELSIKASIGISLFPNDAETPEDLIQLASFAMQRAREQEGHSFHFYHQKKDLSSHKNYTLEKDLRNAIDNQELEVYYQPRVRSSNGSIMGFEALIRWNHPSWGLVMPIEFITLAEESHLIHAITKFVFNEACRKLNEWQQKGIAPRVLSINVSALSVMRQGLADFIKNCLQDYGVDGKWIEIEITESLLMREETIVRTNLHKLKKLGISIALDDFGTGYSSLSYLREFPIDTIKIDKSYVDKIGQNPTNKKGESNPNRLDEHLFATVVYLAHGMDIKVVAEGVEHLHQLKFIQQKECEEVQGYLFSKPVKEAELDMLLRKGKLSPKKKKSTKPKVERRAYYRYSFAMPLQGKLMIKEVKGKEVAAGYTEVLIKDVSIGGLKLVSSLNIPVRPDVQLSLEICLLGETFKLDSRIVWKNEMPHYTYDYGVQFSIMGTVQDQLATIINKLVVLKRNNLTIPDTPFIYENPHTYIHKTATN